MNIKKNNTMIYQFLKDVNYSLFFIAYAVACSILVVAFAIFNILYMNNSNILARLDFGVPLILQLSLMYIVYRENHKNRVVKILFFGVFFYTLICGLLSVYELYYTNPSFVDSLFYYVSNAQIIFQFVIALLLLIFMFLNQVDKLFIVKPLSMVLFTVVIKLLELSGNKFFDGNWILWIFLFTLLINIFNPVLLYILSYTAKGKLFIKYNQ